ncbi:ileal sodium/bile acid cotransporter-like [Amphiura filiformis]|uniref:ileal sodium/bile acid cotransporter-like n=1 Tax=Amphiura filiformis TaxID=82378 RepID=UPI003B20CD64
MEISLITELATTIDISTMNDTDERPPPAKYLDELKLANRILISFILVFIMVGMGCVISIKDIKTTCRRPVGVLIGFISQFLVMPLLTFSLAHALQIKAEFAIGMLIVGCSPGGTVSNLFTYWTNGDICLSVVMTTASVIFAFGMMPLNLFIYSRSWTNETSVIPYKDIVITLACIVLPVALGMLIRYKLKRWAPYVEKINSIVALIGIPIVITLNGLINPRMFTSGWKVWFASVTLPFLGFSIGYGMALLLKQSHTKCRAIAFETGCQNVALTLTLILMTFSEHPDFADLMTFPSLFSIFMMVDPLICVAIWRVKHRTNKNPSHDYKECANDMNEKEMETVVPAAAY